MPANKIVSFSTKGSHFSDLLRMYRERAELSQNDLASLLGLKSARMLQHWEKDTLPRPANLKKIIKLFIERKIFMPGQEREEAIQLWMVVKNNYESSLTDYKTYQLLDRRWLEQILHQPDSDNLKQPNELSDFARLETSSSEATKQFTGKISFQLIKPEADPGKVLSLLTLPPPTLFVVPTIKHNLPFHLTRFIGRNQQIQELIETLAQTRLLTLVGPGGIGKTRLALEVATRLLEFSRFEDGIWLVELAALTEAPLMAQTILQSLELNEEPNRSALATLTDYFKKKQFLLILDNCEQLSGECVSLIYQLLQYCPGLHLLVTSRMPLRLYGEYLWQVPSLSLPDLEEQETLSDTHDLTQYEAIALFAERARASWSGFSLQNQNLAALWGLCHYLDGIPLAIELAAAWVNTLSLEQITSRLQRSIELLKTNSPLGTPPRQQTIHATIEWSYGLLSQAEQTLLKQLAIFAGGCTIEAVEAICSAKTDQNQVLDLMNLLITKSLVIVDHQVAKKLGVVRYRLLETVRQYGLEQLVQDEVQYSALQKRYANYYLGLVEEAEVGLRSSQMELWLSRLKSEYGNVRAVLSCSVEAERGDLTLAVRLVGALGWFWFTLSYMQEGRQWLDKILPRKQEVDWKLQPKLLNTAGTISFLQSELEEAGRFHQEAITLGRQLEDWWRVSFSMGALAIQLGYRGRFEEAVTIAEESLAVARQTEDNWLIVDQHFILISCLTHLNELEKAQILATECLRLSKKLGNKQMLGYTHLYVGKLYKAQGKLGQAHKYLKNSHIIWQALGERRTSLDAINALAEVYYAQGNYGQAEELLTQNLKQSQEIGNPHLIALSLQMIGKLFLQTKRYEEARLYLEQSLSLFEEIGDRLGQSIVSRLLAI